MSIIQVLIHLTFVLVIIHVVGEYRRMYRETFNWAVEQRKALMDEIIALSRKNTELQAYIEKYKC